MTKQDLIDAVAQNAKLNKNQALKFIDELTSLTVAEVQQGHRVVWPNFGTFNYRNFAPRMTRIGRTGFIEPVSGHKQMNFKASAALKDDVN